MCNSTFKPLLNLAAAAILSQSGAVPEWGEHLLSVGFTNALRTIESAEATRKARPALGSREVIFTPQGKLVIRRQP
jgi:hypothetical protein